MRFYITIRKALLFMVYLEEDLLHKLVKEVDCCHQIVLGRGFIDAQSSQIPNKCITAPLLEILTTLQ